MAQGESLHFGAFLKRLRVEADLSQEQLAERAQVSAQAIGAYERGLRSSPYRDTVALLANALDLSPETRAELERLAERRRGPQKQPRGAVEPHNNLPTRLTTFVGRSRELDEIRELVLRHRLVNIVGTGGAGKTSVALEIAKQVLRTFPDGVWLADLAPLEGPVGIEETIAAAFGIRCSDTDSATLAVLMGYLRDRAAMLILDNCEHILDGVAAVTTPLLDKCAKLRILATSRERLALAGERVYRLPPMGLPKPGLKDAEAVGRCDAVALFVERASAVNPRFTLTGDNAGIVSSIVSQLDGIPLAIELAAARVHILPPAELDRRLDKRLAVLGHTTRGGVPRQRTLDALISWSYELLTAAERVCFERCSIFAGSFSLASVHAVCADEGAEETETLDVLASIFEKSLIVADPHIDGRFRMLQSVRAYAQERLEASGGWAHAMSRLAEWLATFASFEVGTSPPELDAELENARPVFQWSLEDGGDATLGIQGVTAFAGTWNRMRHVGEGKRWTEAFLSFADEAAQPRLAARLWHAFALFTFARHCIDATDHAIRLYEIAGDRRGRAKALIVRAENLRRTATREDCDASIELAESLLIEDGGVNSREYAEVLKARAHTFRQFDPESAIETEELFTRASELYLRLGDGEGAALCRVNIAEVVFANGNTARALALAEQAVHDLRYERSSELTTQCNIVAYRLAAGDDKRAWIELVRVLETARQTGFTTIVNIAIGHMALIAARSGQVPEAALLKGYIDAWYVGAGAQREPTEQRLETLLDCELSARLGATEVEELRRQGATLSMDAAFDVALSIRTASRVSVRRRRPS